MFYTVEKWSLKRLEVHQYYTFMEKTKLTTSVTITSVFKTTRLQHRRVFEIPGLGLVSPKWPQGYGTYHCPQAPSISDCHIERLERRAHHKTHWNVRHVSDANKLVRFTQIIKIKKVGTSKQGIHVPHGPEGGEVSVSLLLPESAAQFVQNNVELHVLVQLQVEVLPDWMNSQPVSSHFCQQTDMFLHFTCSLERRNSQSHDSSFWIAPK